MAVPINTTSDLGHLWSSRALIYGTEHRTIDDLVGVYDGNLPEEFNDLFHEEMHLHVVNLIRLAWDDLANLAGKEMPLYVEPDNDTSAAKQRAELQEKIGYGYNKAGRISGGISMKLLMKVLSWWLVGAGSAVAMVLPDYKRKTPYFTFRDVRSFYPPAGWSPYTQAAADDALFAYQLTMGEIKRRWPDKADAVSQSMASSFGPGPLRSRVDDNTTLWVGEFYTEETWQVATLEDKSVTLLRSDQGDKGHPNVQPTVSFGLYDPGSNKGRSIFADQISIQAAMARMFSQKLDYFDRSLYPLIFHTPLAGKTIRIGPYATNEYAIEQGVNPRMDMVAPQNPVDADQTMNFVMGMSRMLNRNPEMMQGVGDADSAKALEALKAGINQTIQGQIWPPMVEVLPSLYSKAAAMDLALWPNERKRATGTRKNANFSVSYTPSTDLKGREDDFEIEPGVGLAGYQGTLEILQLVGAELMSEDTALEQGEWVREPQEEKRKIQRTRMEKLIWADLQAKAATGILKPGAFAEIRRLVEEKSKDLFDAIAMLEKTGQLYQEPVMPEGPPGVPGIPGAPPGPGGPGEEPMPMPPLSLLRGGAA